MLRGTQDDSEVVVRLLGLSMCQTLPTRHLTSYIPSERPRGTVAVPRKRGRAGCARRFMSGLLVAADRCTWTGRSVNDALDGLRMHVPRRPGRALSSRWACVLPCALGRHSPRYLFAHQNASAAREQLIAAQQATITQQGQAIAEITQQRDAFYLEKLRLEVRLAKALKQASRPRADRLSDPGQPLLEFAQRLDQLPIDAADLPEAATPDAAESALPQHTASRRLRTRGRRDIGNLDHLPIIEQVYELTGELHRSTLCLWLADAARRMVARVLQSHVLATDDTVLPLLQPGKAKQARMWVYQGDEQHPYNVFDFTESRKRDGLSRFLRDVRGTLLADAYGGYDGTVVNQDLPRAGCWAHARRKFVETEPAGPEVTRVVLRLTNALLELETRLTDVAVSPGLSHDRARTAGADTPDVAATRRRRLEVCVNGGREVQRRGG